MRHRRAMILADCEEYTRQLEELVFRGLNAIEIARKIGIDAVPCPCSRKATPGRLRDRVSCSASQLSLALLLGSKRCRQLIGLALPLLWISS